MKREHVAMFHVLSHVRARSGRGVCYSAGWSHCWLCIVGILQLNLCHRVVDGLCGREPPHRGDHGASWNLEEWLELLDSLTALFRRAVGSNSSDEEVLAGLADVDSSHAESVLSVLRARREEIRDSLLDRTNSISSATLQDFDWQLKLALSSDKISSLHTPLLSLSLDVRENRALRSVTMEMNREELNTLISSLEAANKVVLQLK
ncbi:COMM domain-containing protein 8 isoform X1 [Anarrhichthys ocellatus]|uniref:COMM domain-containing protein 8 isoform X1 n=1 Tax=Anarrhichthys ocellatus TaxID=433405 RepID=UPI0012EE52E9|nr:COMM domain-containing protein 8 isoform X1 [Anarrhichthys ocellatus]